jgi:hypothetical protein
LVAQASPRPSSSSLANLRFLPQVIVDVLVIETVDPVTFEGIVKLLGGQGFAMVERQVSS